MLVLLFHFSLGLMTGTQFGIKTLLMIVFLLPIEALVAPILGVSVDIGLWFCAGMVLQAGYFGGAILRVALERFATVIGLHPSSNVDLG